MPIIVSFSEATPTETIERFERDISREMKADRQAAIFAGIGYGLVAGFILGAVVIRVLL